jgi:general secretion pathway protein G
MCLVRCGHHDADLWFAPSEQRVCSTQPRNRGTPYERGGCLRGDAMSNQQPPPGYPPPGHQQQPACAGCGQPLQGQAIQTPMGWLHPYCASPPQQPKKKGMRAAAIVLLVLGALGVLGVGTCVGSAYLVAPEYKKAKIKAAAIGASTIKQAAQTYIEVDMVGGADTCPTIHDLVAGRRIDRQKTDDPWGVPYMIQCAGGEIHVVSAGNDRKLGTPDDVRDDLKPADVEKIAEL